MPRNPPTPPHSVQPVGSQIFKNINERQNDSNNDEQNDFELSDEAKKNFVKYLKLVFEDLCARDNGNTRASFGLYTFLKVCLMHFYLCLVCSGDLLLLSKATFYDNGNI